MTSAFGIAMINNAWERTAPPGANVFVGRAGPGPAFETTLTCVMETNLFPCIGPKFRRINRTIHLKSGSGPCANSGTEPAHLGTSRRDEDERERGSRLVWLLPVFGVLSSPHGTWP